MYECECGGVYEEVTDSRHTKRGQRRRRECDKCGKRITTLEIIYDADKERIERKRDKLIAEFLKQLEEMKHEEQ